MHLKHPFNDISHSSRWHERVSPDLVLHRCIFIMGLDLFGVEARGAKPRARPGQWRAHSSPEVAEAGLMAFPVLVGLELELGVSIKHGPGRMRMWL